MGVDLGDVRGLKAGIVKRQLHTADRSRTTRCRGGDVVCVSIAGASQNFADDGCAAGCGNVPRLENEYRSAFAHDETIATLVERGAFAA